MIDPVNAISSMGNSASAAATNDKPSAPLQGFHRIIDELLGTNVRDEAQATRAVLDVALGASDDIPGAALAVGKADLSFRKVLEIRNKLIDAYQEVMRMQV